MVGTLLSRMTLVLSYSASTSIFVQRSRSCKPFSQPSRLYHVVIESQLQRTRSSFTSRASRLADRQAMNQVAPLPMSCPIEKAPETLDRLPRLYRYPSAQRLLPLAACMQTRSPTSGRTKDDMWTCACWPGQNAVGSGRMTHLLSRRRSTSIL
ncbi:hypothetical protein FB567DRAFT_94786 [Paraphoma chrysanthemicola]|uniref:Uncharacterized protein n=1 Tax=Paraphoma chrysanthemicola TaxID=798071 RepID=A0A8K0R4U2_9PLEO|nr:hypothetical protein FB567DRAFT_94786 [Paraphoma chrysanthemicola]